MISKNTISNLPNKIIDPCIAITKQYGLAKGNSINTGETDLENTPQRVDIPEGFNSIFQLRICQDISSTQRNICKQSSEEYFIFGNA